MSLTLAHFSCTRDPGNIAKAAGKRVADTDILMHAWIGTNWATRRCGGVCDAWAERVVWRPNADFGIDSRKGQESWEHLNRIHAVWKRRTSNQDFVYVLCCFIVDTIRFIDVFGWRKLTSLEREGTPRALVIWRPLVCVCYMCVCVCGFVC